MPEVLKSVDFAKTQQFRYLEYETWLFVQMRKIMILSSKVKAILLQK